MIDKLAWILLREGRILGTRSKGKDTWYIPGGKREAGESDHQALTREVHEELSVHLVPSTIQPFGTFTAQAHGKDPGVMVQMTCYTADYEGELVAASEIAEIRWLGLADRGMVSAVDKLIFDDLRTKRLLT